MSDFWEDMQAAFVGHSAIDDFLSDQGLESEHFTQVRELVDKPKNALRLPVDAGTRVRFLANLGSVMSYPDVPDDGVEGTVVTVRSAAGDTTFDDDRVFVLWDDGKFRPILACHLARAKSSKKMARAVRLVVADINSLGISFSPVLMTTGDMNTGDDLVHKATKDLWSFRQDGDNYVIERLFDETGEPLKV